MHPEQDSEHKVNQSIVLAQIQNLQYCASIPQHPKVNPSEEFEYKGGITTAQEKTIELIKEHYKKGEKIIIPLSGGLDSRAILAAALKCTPKKNIITFTFGEKGSFESKNDGDEFKP